MHWYYYKPGHYPLIDVSKIKRDKVETYYIMYWSTDPSFTSQELPKRRPQWRTVQPRHHSSLREGNAVRWVALMLKCRANACMAWHKSLSHRQSQVINYFIWHNMLASKISINIDKASLVFWSGYDLEVHWIFGISDQCCKIGTCVIHTWSCQNGVVCSSEPPTLHSTPFLPSAPSMIVWDNEDSKADFTNWEKLLYHSRGAAPGKAYEVRTKWLASTPCTVVPWTGSPGSEQQHT